MLEPTAVGGAAAPPSPVGEFQHDAHVDSWIVTDTVAYMVERSRKEQRCRVSRPMARMRPGSRSCEGGSLNLAGGGKLITCQTLACACSEKSSG